MASAWSLVTGESIGHGKPLWCNAFDNTSRQVTQYRRGRILLAGDAAHRQMPVGGQALNLGLHDAAELGGRLAGRVRAVGDDELLDGYHHERHPAGARTLANIRAQTALLLGGPEVEPVRELMTELMRIPAVHSRLASMISGVLVKCDAGRDRPSGESGSARASAPSVPAEQDEEIG
nr:FAD-dependent monooxygenase [Nocardia kruczakiae]